MRILKQFAQWGFPFFLCLLLGQETVARTNGRPSFIPGTRTKNGVIDKGCGNRLRYPSVLSRQPTSKAKSKYETSLSLVVSPEPIHTAFSIATFLPQPFFLLMILLPNVDITKKIMKGNEVLLIVCLVHFFIVSASIATGGSEATAPLEEFNEVFNPSGDPQKAFVGMVSSYPNFVAEEWSHVLTWDFFVGRYIWMDGLKRGIFTSHSVLLTNLIGPPGLLLHWLTCLLTGKSWISNDSDIEKE